MKLIVTFFTVILLAAPSLRAQGPSPVEQRLREQLKSVMQRMSAAEAELASEKAKSKKFEEEISAYKKNIEEDARKLKEAEEAKAKLETELKAENERLKAENTSLGQKMVIAQKRIDDTTARLEKTEAERAELKIQVATLKNIVTDQRRKNAKMLEIGQEILSRYEKFGLGTAITAREPFTGITRARLESMVDDYDSQLAAARIRLDGTTPKTGSNERPADGKPGEKKPASKP